MTIAGMSDLHGYLPEDIPKCDIVCICGDISPLRIQTNTHEMRKWLNNTFLPWVDSLKCKKVVMIWGNHDWFGFRHPEWSNMINEKQDKLIILQDNKIEIESKTFYGTPWCPDLRNWAFYGTSNELRDKFFLIPENVDVLLTHCPPRIDLLGTVLQHGTFNYMSDYGCKELADAIKEKNPKIVLSGHVHTGIHTKVEYNGTILSNVSIKDEFYEPSYIPFVLDI